ncbi:DUF3667 domain-containing protein [Chryseobacterium nematophagum]|uniref:DUF3667 domain-containing protein n=1 Tax=Chryseobacterium nematophagum TaxID=2305228 RepID=A0A3M7TJD0_9FLAO|nr:DUF3667 domain-containing protein [Chryseobacterium nematophagum]RNA63661.1 DUF3667 domain-containing protein [Chryseobacterium nematophagum]
MSHGKLREEKLCLNCENPVEERFCPHCGQENVEPRQPFYYLFTHFIEDFTHYDGQFWKTIQYLLFRPGKLTKEYLAGKRQLYVAPVKLYIFISFITFLLPSLLSSSKNESEDSQKVTSAEKIKQKKDAEKEFAKITDSIKSEVLKNEVLSKNKNVQPLIENNLIKINEIKNNAPDESLIDETEDGKIKILGAENKHEFDSTRRTSGENKFLYAYSEPFAKKIFSLQEKGLNKKEIFARYKSTFIHTLPKALFLYLPVFAFFLWIFHNKKKWWFFDHGIFTLHYFSFLLLGILLLIFISRLLDKFPDYGLFTLLAVLIHMAIIIYMSLYFFIAHYRVYESRKRMTILKGSLLFMINFVGILLMFLALMYISFLMMH